MKRLLGRIASALLVLAASSVGIFGLMRLTPGNPADTLAGPDATPAVIAAITRQLGLHQPIPLQYWRWLSGVLSGNLGHSYILGQPIGSLIAHAAGNTIELTTGAFVFALLFGGILGVAEGVTRNRLLLVLYRVINSLALSVPTFVSGVLGVLLFAVILKWLPPGGAASFLDQPIEALKLLVMPAVALGLPVGAVIARFMQASIRQVLQLEYITTARAKGLPWRRTLFRHALPNALPPLLAVVGIQIGQLLGGAVIVEAVFAWPGMGSLVLNAALSNDYLVIQDVLVIAVAVFVVLQALTDIGYALIDPRVRGRG